MKILRNDHSLLLFGQIVVALFFCALLLTSLGWLVQIPITGLHLFVSFAAAVFLVWFINERDKQTWRVGAWAFALLVFFGVVGAVVFDNSYDGQAYHQAMIASLTEGWNPFYVHHSNVLPLNEGINHINNHYLRGAESIQALFYAATGWIESAKAINMMLIAASFSFVLYMLRSRFAADISRRKIWLFAVLFTLCPVVLTQVLTFYIDFVMYSLLLCGVSLVVSQDPQTQHSRLLCVAMLTAIAITIKLNTFFFFGLFVLIYLGWALYTKKFRIFRRTLIYNAAAAAGGVFLLAYGPFVTNTIDHGHPFYPLMVSAESGEEVMEIMSFNTPIGMRENNRLENIFIANFSLPTNNLNEPVHWGLPTKASQVILTSNDTRIGGFGLFFGLSIVLASVLYLSTRVGSNNARRAFGVVIVALLGGVFFFAEGWWARYVPFFWALPLVMMLYWDLSADKRKWQKTWAKVTYIFLVVNLITATGSFGLSLKHTYLSVQQIRAIKQYEPVALWVGSNVSIPEKLDLWGVQYTKLRTMPDTSASTILWIPCPVGDVGAFILIEPNDDAHSGL